MNNLEVATLLKRSFSAIKKNATELFIISIIIIIYYLKLFQSK